MSERHRVVVSGVPDWVPAHRLLGKFAWEALDGTWQTQLSAHDAADVAARLRGIGIGGSPVSVTIEPSLSRAWVRDARTADARRRRETTPGFTKKEVRWDDEGRWSLTPEVLALRLGQRAGGRTVIDAGCGVGGNAIGFARAGSQVVAYEQNPQRLALARHNARSYGVEARIRFIAGDASAQWDSEPADLLFVDPPWGIEWNHQRTTADQFPLLLAAWKADFPEVWAKLPPSFDPTTLPNARPEAWFGEAEGDRQRVKFLLVRRTAS